MLDYCGAAVFPFACIETGLALSLGDAKKSESPKALTFFCIWFSNQKMTILKDKITELALPIIGEENIYLLDIDIKGSHASTVVWVMMDATDGGLNIDKCAKISRELSFQIESKNLISGKYTLNVSSPGLDRPLSDIRQYISNLGRVAKVKYIVSDKTENIKGTIKSVNNSVIELETDKKSVTIPFSDILETKIIPII